MIRGSRLSEWTGSRNNRSITKLECYSGASHSATRDEKPHGYLKDTTVKSAKMFVGFFNDWRFGMEKFGETNAGYYSET